MAWFFYRQKTPESAWEISDARLREAIIKETKPPFTTILDLDTEITDEMGVDDLRNVHYRGPLYFDFDSDDIGGVIPKFQKFLSKLEEMGIDLAQIELYATGGRGFHVVVPMQVFLTNPSKRGYRFLPHIYKEMAYGLYVDTLDMRVYSARKGRMFRTANVERTNGKYKVQLTVEQARCITPERYESLTSKPGPVIKIADPVMNPELALRFTQARSKVEEVIKKRKGRSGVDAKLVEAFSGLFPSTLQMIGRGEHIREGCGFQKIATQLAITAHALGKTEHDLLQVCEGLIESHQSDGSRYNTPTKRKRELSRMYHYMQDNPCYEFSSGAIRSLVEEGVTTSDLDLPTEDPYGVIDEDDEDDDADEAVSKGVRFNKQGIFAKKRMDDGTTRMVTLSRIGIDNVASLQTLGDPRVCGYEIDLYVEGKFRYRTAVSINAMLSVTEFRRSLSAGASAAMQMTDAQVNAMLDRLRKRAEKNNRTVTNVPREGVDVVPLPDTETETNRVEIIYAGPSAYGVITKDSSGDPDRKTGYRLQTVNGSVDGEFKSDLLSAPILEDTPQTQRFFDRFFDLYEPGVMSRVVGFYLACFLAQPLRYVAHQFPMLQVYGLAGTGKTSMNHLLSHLHSYRRAIPIWSAGDITPFALQSILQSSGSIPVILDELKRREMRSTRAQDFLMIMRNNYTGNSGGKGKVTRDVGQSTLAVVQHASVAPLVFLSEEMETQTAVIDRSVVVAMQNVHRFDSKSPWHACMNDPRVLSSLGHLCVRKVLELNLGELADQVKAAEMKLAKSCARTLTSRQLYNNAVVLVGLEFGRRVLGLVFGKRYDEKIRALRDTLVTTMDESVPVNQSEASKVLSTLAHLSGKPATDPFGLVLGVDYQPSVHRATKEPCVEIHLFNAWDKYSRYRRAQGEEVLYQSEAAFISAMTHHPCAVDLICAGSTLKGGRSTVKVVRFQLRRLYNEERVEEFDMGRAVMEGDSVTSIPED